MIEIRNISKKYGRHLILNNISFNIHQGECIGIIGANGSGKTTLLSIISGIIKADTGNILADGKIISDSPKSISGHISYVPQENPLIHELTAMDNLRLWYSGSKKELKQELEDGVLKSLGINEFANRTVSKLSGGMKKRLSIGIALLEKPSLLIMDEPSAALDLTGKYKIKAYMKQYTTQMKGSILVVSHDQNELSVCDKLFLLKDGQLLPIDSDLKDSELINLL